MGKVTHLNGGEGEGPSQGLHLREISGDAALLNESVGKDLRSARLARGEELTHVSRALRISKNYLEALENDQPQKLPGRTYAIGFVRAYAGYLGLDTSSLASRYKVATAGLAESAPQVGPAPEPVGFRPGVGWTALGIAAAALLVYGIYALSRPPLHAPPALAGPPAPMKVHARTFTSRAPLRLAAVRPRAPILVAQPPPGAGAAALATGQVLGAQNLGARVVLHARVLTHVLIEGPGGKVYINRLLHPGDVYRVPNLVGLSLTTPDGGAVSLELDGHDLGAAGKNGRIVEALSLDPATIVHRKSAGVPGQADKVTP